MEKKSIDRRSFVKTGIFAGMGAGIASRIPTWIQKISKRIEDSDKTHDQERQEITMAYDNMRNFYIEKSNLTGEDKKNKEKVHQFIHKVFVDHLNLEEIQSRINDRFKILEELIRRWELVVNIQEVLKVKLAQIGEDKVVLDNFVDGKFGRKTSELCENILGIDSMEDKLSNTIFKDREELFTADKETLINGLDRLENENFKTSFVEISDNNVDYIKKIQEELKKYQVTENDYKQEAGLVIKGKITKAMALICDKKRVLNEQYAKSEKQRIEKGRWLLLVAINYLIKSWQGFRADKENGWAHYPFDERGKRDANSSKIDCSTYVLRIMQTLFPNLIAENSAIAMQLPPKELKSYQRILGGIKSEKEEDKGEKRQEVFMIKAVKGGFGGGHIEIVFLDLEDHISNKYIVKISEASGEHKKVLNRLFFPHKKERGDKSLSLSGDEVVKNWLEN